MRPNCCTDFNETVEWLKSVKEDLKITNRIDLLDALDFDSDMYPDGRVLEAAAYAVFPEESAETFE